MNGLTVSCLLCKREVSSKNFNRHLKTHLDISNKISTECQFCGSLKKNKNSLINHERLCKLNPHSQESPFVKYNKERECIWNKGLTKNTDERILNQAKTFKLRLENGEITPSCAGKKLSPEHKDKISKGRIKYLEENPDKVPYLINHSSKQSWPEKFFQKLLEDNEIAGWIYNYQCGIYSYDFAFPELKIDIEIDGATHQSEKVKAIDKRRDEYSKERGWKVLRIDAKELYQEDKEHIVKLVKSFL